MIVNRKAAQLLQSCEKSLGHSCTQGFKANPGLKLANAFSVTQSRGRTLESFNFVQGPDQPGNQEGTPHDQGK